VGAAGTVTVGTGGAPGAGGTTTGAAGTPGSGGGTSTTPPVKEASPSGCSCAVVGDSGGERGGATLLVGFGLALLGLRRRNAGQHAR
jgi:MYXO-CTERM domain-containing protein